MDFCPKCGAVLVEKKKKFGCPRCNYSTKEKVKIKTSEKMNEKKEVAIVKKDFKVHPAMIAECKKCGNDKAYFWAVQMRAADEAEVKFFQCTKCEYTWKEYR